MTKDPSLKKQENAEPSCSHLLAPSGCLAVRRFGGSNIQETSFQWKHIWKARKRSRVYSSEARYKSSIFSDKTEDDFITLCPVVSTFHISVFRNRKYLQKG
ncbi:hypothetical protein C0J52_24370 [Blattella germanica]|nr:hypothetical protein C0J52_24370 [Blattella germanica]